MYYAFITFNHYFILNKEIFNHFIRFINNSIAIQKRFYMLEKQILCNKQYDVIHIHLPFYAAKTISSYLSLMISANHDKVKIFCNREILLPLIVSLLQNLFGIHYKCCTLNGEQTFGSLSKYNFFQNCEFAMNQCSKSIQKMKQIG